MKLRGRHFDTIQGIKVESLAVLNTLTKYNFQNTFKNCRSAGELCILAEGDYFESDGPRNY
jgi:hypothetical protein